jgi:hypothetical protein
LNEWEDIDEVFGTNGSKCGAYRALVTITTEQHDMAVRAMARPWSDHPQAIPHKNIAEKLSEWTGLRVTGDMVGKHRRKACSCE